MSMTGSEAQDPKAFTGRTILYWLLGFFGVVFAANAAFIWLALGTFPGVVVESSYQAGQVYNHDIAEAKEQSARGWQVDTDLSRTTELGAFLEVDARDKANAPLSGMVFTAVLKHPVYEGHDVSVELKETGSGHYTADLANVMSGNWTLFLEARKDGQRLFRSENRLFLKD